MSLRPLSSFGQTDFLSKWNSAADDASSVHSGSTARRSKRVAATAEVEVESEMAQTC